jgi:hypothetical protein
LRQKTEDKSTRSEAKCPDSNAIGLLDLLQRIFSWIAKKRLLERGVFLALTALCIGLASIYLRNHQRYAQVKSWPSVPVTVQSLASHSSSIPFQNRWGGSSTIHLTRTNVHFTYTVGGVVYQGTRPSPDDEIPTLFAVSINGGQPSVPEPRAYYSPTDPAIAVLYPIAYRGHGLLATAIVSGGLLGLYGFFSLRL